MSLGFVNVSTWLPEQVGKWLAGLGKVSIYSGYPQMFKDQGVDGIMLLNLSYSELHRLGVKRFGHQENILEAIETLSKLHHELDAETVQALALKLSCSSSSLKNELKKLLLDYNDIDYTSRPMETLPLRILSAISNTIEKATDLTSWLDRPPFYKFNPFIKKRNELMKTALCLVNATQNPKQRQPTSHTDVLLVDRNESLLQNIIGLCQNIQEIAEYFIIVPDDPLIIQPSTLEIVNLKRIADEELGMHIVSSYNGIHNIESIKENSPAHLCGKVDNGDEVVQVNYQTVVGWEASSMVKLLQEAKEVTLTLKKRPRHIQIQGNKRRKNLSKKALQQSTFPKQRSKKSSRNSRPPLKDNLFNRQTTQTESSEVPMNSDSGDVFRISMDNDSFDYQLDGKHRRATVSGGSPTLKRPTIKITPWTGRPKSSYVSIGSPSSEDSTGTDTGSTTPESITSPVLATQELKEEVLAAAMSLNLKDDLHAPASEPLKTKHYSGIPGTDPIDSPQLIRVTRINSARRMILESQSSREADTETDVVPSQNKSRDSQVNNYTVKIIGGVPVKSQSSVSESPNNPGYSPSILRKNHSKKSMLQRVVANANRRISCKDLGSGDCQGWLWKKKDTVKVLGKEWVKRWCVLKNNNLYYYKTKEDLKAQGVIYLPAIKISPAPEIKSKKFAFKAHHSGTTFYFASERQDDMGKWMNKLGLASIAYERKERSDSLRSGNDNITYYSESEDESELASLQGDSLEGAAAFSEETESLSPSRSGTMVMRKVLDNIKDADLNLDGGNKDQQRKSLLNRLASIDQEVDKNVVEDILRSRKLVSLERTLRVKERELSQIENLLAHETITKIVLAEFLENNPETQELMEGIHHESSSSESEMGEPEEFIEAL